MSANTPPSLAEWKKLYELAQEVKKLAPWKWLDESRIFGVKSPENDEVVFVSVMGQLGEHLAVAIYPGVQALYKFLEVEFSGGDVPPETVLEIPQLQISFENRDLIDPEDYEIIKKLGLKFRGKQAWPLFRSYQPEYCPWFMDAAEVRLTITVLEQLLELTPRLQSEPNLLPELDTETFLVRSMTSKGKKNIWQDELIKIEPPEMEMITFTMPLEKIDAAKKLPRGKQILLMDLFRMPIQIESKGDRPAWLYMFLVIDLASKQLLLGEPCDPSPKLADMWATLPEKIIDLFHRIGNRPKEIRVRPGNILFPLIDALPKGCHIKTVESAAMEELDLAKDMMMQFMMLGGPLDSESN
jgi:hypothetical protein